MPSRISQQVSPHIISNPWQRLHWASVPIVTFRSLRALLIPALVVLFSQRNSESMGTLAAGGVFTLLGVAISFWRYYGLRFFTNGIELVVEKGLIGREVRSIRLEQIQDLRVKQGIVHRLMGVADVEIDTAGGKGAEEKLSVLSLATIDDLRAQVGQARLRRRPGDEVAGVTEPPVGLASDTTAPNDRASSRVVRQTSLGELVVAGLTSNSILSGLAVIGVAWGLLNDFIPEERIFQYARDGILAAKQHLGGVDQLNWVSTVMLTLFGGAALFAMALAFSVAGTISRYFRYSLTQSDKGIKREGGLFTRRSSMLNVDRVQSMSFDVGLLRRPIRKMAIYVTTAASAADPDQDKQDMLLPIARWDEASGIAGLIYPDQDLSGITRLSRVSRVQITRGVTKSAVFFLLVASGLVVYFNSFWPVLVVLVLPVSVLLHVRGWKVCGYCLSRGMWHTRKGLIGWRYRLMPTRNTQVVLLTQSPFDRRHGVASICVDCAGERPDNLGNLPVATALRLARSLAGDATQTAWPARGLGRPTPVGQPPAANPLASTS